MQLLAAPVDAQCQESDSPVDWPHAVWHYPPALWNRSLMLTWAH